jgi:integrase
MDGQKIDTSSDTWWIRRSADGGKMEPINWRLLESIPGLLALSERTKQLIRLYLADRIRRKKAATVQNDFKMFCRFFRWLAVNTDLHSFDWSDLSEGIGRSFLDHSVKHTADKGNHFSRLRTFYEWGVARQYPDFDRRTLLILQSIAAPGNSKGHHVRFRHETKGPLSPDEKLLVSRSLTAGKGTERDRVIVMLHLELGMNPNSTARLKNKDFRRFQVGDAVECQLDVPRVKKRTACRETKRRPISKRLGELIEKLQRGGAEDPLLYWLTDSRPEDGIRESLKRFADEADLVSPHTQKRLHLSPRRLRVTLATQMAEEGASKFHIAEVLDHTDLQNVDVYVETASTITDYIEKATDHALKPLVNRFLGKIVDSVEAQVFEDISNQVIPADVPHLPLPALNAGGVGLCGRDVRKDGLCRLFPPLSCYLCPSFAALRSGPHRELLESIETFIREWERCADKRILMQLDDVRIAISQVLEQLAASAAASSATPETLLTTGGDEA